MRVVLVGDLQYRAGEKIDHIVDEINTLEADAVIVLGDYAYGEIFGAYEAFDTIAQAFKNLNCGTFIPMVGNHDVQHEAGECIYPNGRAAANYEKAFGKKPCNQVLEFEDFRVFIIHSDSQKKGDCWTVNECYVSDEHFDQIKAQLEKDPEKPAIMVTHAPIVESGLLTVPQTHVRATNAYMDQDHGYQRWIDLADEYRQIIMWFNGHYHMGHHHRDSMNVRDGLVYFVTGCATSASRDGQHHTRVVDVNHGEIIVSTYDHDSKCISEDYRQSLEVRPQQREERPITKKFAAGCGAVVSGGLKVGKNSMVYAQTDNDYLWEIDTVHGIANGTLHYSDKDILETYTIDETCVWRVCGDKIYSHAYREKQRFMREKDWEKCVFKEDVRANLPPDLGETFIYQGHQACRIGDDMICFTYNDADGRLYFETVKE
ncbi:MAG: metallophosphoesterase family protein [Firmicutes bacterium]|nr:metallophosphoesterase family protein [Bacillota bacterium]